VSGAPVAAAVPPAHRADAAGRIDRGRAGKADAAPRLAVTTPLPETVAALNEFRPEAPTAHPSVAAHGRGLGVVPLDCDGTTEALVPCRPASPVSRR
jgi:hypothetical protein